MSASRRVTKVGLAGAALLGVLSCSRPVLEGARLEQLAQVAAQVNEERLMGTLSEVVKAHQEDTPLGCAWLTEDQRSRHEVVCHLTREKAAALLQERFQELGLSVRRNESATTPFPTSNVIAELPGVTRPQEVVLVGAHYDAFYDGADDNSSGVAALLEIARVLSQYKFDRTVRFVGFDMEEFGLVGSSRYIGEYTGPERIVASMVFDCIGYYDTQEGTQQSLPGLPAPSTGDFLAVFGNDTSSQRVSELFALNNALKLAKVTPIIAPRDGTSPLTGNLLRSDHAPFWLTGHEAIFLTDTANFRNRNYHQPTDTVDTLNPAYYRRTVQLSAATLAYWAGGPR
ncbi:MAG TPA: M28 family peptidase [Archangium sp.]|nr:M28 family peptidase [Archangium sp.]